jgi:hypothetical protein
MGIECAMYQITPDELETILDSEAAFEKFHDSCFPETLDEDEGIEFSSMEENSLYLGKMWHLLHYLITGDADNEDYPLACAVMAGYLLHKSWNDWSFLPSDQVKEIAEALVGLSDDDLRRVGEIRPIPEIYRTPSISKDTVEEALDYFHNLKDYYQDASDNGNAILRSFG